MKETEYLWVCLMEECGEIAELASKTLRFGIDSDYKDGVANRDKLATELTDLLAVVEMLGEAGVALPQFGVAGEIEKKKAKLRRFMEYSRRAGCLDARGLCSHCGGAGWVPEGDYQLGCTVCDETGLEPHQ